MKAALKTLLALALLALGSALPAEVQHTLNNLERDLDDINYAVVSQDQIHDLERLDLEKLTSHTAYFPPLDWDVINNSPEHPLHHTIAWRKQMEGMTDLERQQHAEQVAELEAKLAAAETDEERAAILKAIKGLTAAVNTIVVLRTLWENIETATVKVELTASIEMGISGGLELGTAAIAIYVHVRARPQSAPASATTTHLCASPASLAGERRSDGGTRL